MASLLRGTNNTRAILPDSLRYIRSNLPRSLDASDIAWLIENSITTLVDLRTEDERAAKPCPLAEHPAFRYLPMPVTGGNAVPASPDEVSRSYVAMVDEKMERIIDAITSADTNVLYFCSAGKDRTGVVSAILLHRLGFEREYIVADYLQTAENRREMLRKYAEEHPEVDLEVITPQRRYMDEFLDWFERYEAASK